jgi:hypothetical protein
MRLDGLLDRSVTGDLLKTIREQAQDVRDARRRRRSPVDVNPDTGEPELPDSEPPAAEASPDDDDE